MVKPSWYIPPVNDDAKRMRDEVSKQGSIIWEDTEEDWPVCPLLFYGSIDGMKYVQQEGSKVPSWTHPTVVDWCDWDKLRCQSYYARWGPFMLSQKYGFYPLGEIRRLNSKLWSWYYKGWYPGLFVRPDTNDKCFDGMLVSNQNLKLWLGTACKGLPDDLLCLVAAPEPIQAEFRLVMANGEVVAASQYMLDEKISYAEVCPDGAKEIARAAAHAWSPHPVFVIDIAKSSDSYFILECGSIHTAGLYACNLEPVVRAMELHATK